MQVREQAPGRRRSVIHLSRQLECGQKDGGARLRPVVAKRAIERGEGFPDGALTRVRQRGQEQRIVIVATTREDFRGELDGLTPPPIRQGDLGEVQERVRIIGSALEVAPDDSFGGGEIAGQKCGPPPRRARVEAVGEVGTVEPRRLGVVAGKVIAEGQQAPLRTWIETRVEVLGGVVETEQQPQRGRAGEEERSQLRRSDRDERRPRRALLDRDRFDVLDDRRRRHRVSHAHSGRRHHGGRSAFDRPPGLVGEVPDDDHDEVDERPDAEPAEGEEL
jgi:hypothetical protein